MQIYEQKFDDALKYLSHPDRLNPTGDKPICYVTYDVTDAMIVYRLLKPTIIPKAQYHGFPSPKIVSMGAALQSFIKEHEYYDVFCSDEIPEDEMYSALREELIKDKFFPQLIMKLQEEEKAKYGEHALLIFKDLELLHPYVKIGAIEQIIYNKIAIPMLFLYPGNTQGTARQFLNIYNMDGSYRSKNF